MDDVERRLQVKPEPVAAAPEPAPAPEPVAAPAPAPAPSPAPVAQLPVDADAQAIVQASADVVLGSIRRALEAALRELGGTVPAAPPPGSAYARSRGMFNEVK